MVENINKEKTLKEMKQELKEFYETQIEKEKQVIKEGWDKLNESILDDSNSKSLTISSIRVIVGQIAYASEKVGELNEKILANKIWMIENKNTKQSERVWQK